MGGFPFLVLLAIYAVVFLWYALEAEKGGRGFDGLLGMRKGDEKKDNTARTEISARDRIRQKSMRNKD